MKLTIPQPDLIAGINRVRSVVNTTTTLPVLKFLKLAADDGVLSITATDYSMEATVRVAADVETAGDMLVESAKLYDFARRIPADRNITIEPTGVKAGRSRAKLPTLPADEFPSISRPIDISPFSLTADDIARVLFGPAPAVSDEELRYYLCGVYLHTVDEKLVGVATDGHKLIMQSIAAPDELTLDLGVIIPEKPIITLQKCMSDNDVTVAADAQMIRFSSDSFDITSRLVDGTFPDYSRIIPDDRPNPVTVDRAETLAVIDRLSSVADDEHQILIFEHDADGIAVRTDRKSSIEAHDVIAAETGDAFPYVGLAAKKLDTLLKAMTGDSVTWHFGDSMSPHIFTDPDSPDDVYILMPARA